ncbi:metallophosphoesterase [Rhodobacteraceae bacterium NNCM2]|nr:metallophosphoesterase [Coraliihabitans acroporae]
MISRRAFLGWLFGLAAASGGYAAAVEPGLMLRVREWNVRPPRWPRGLPLRIVMIADPHCAEPHMPLSRLERIVARANTLGGDVIVLMGDYVAGHRFVTRHIPAHDIAPVLGRLKAPLGVHAILGNHDWWEDAPAQARRAGPTAFHGAMAEAGINLLENTATRLEHQGQPFWIAGMGDPIAFLHQPYPHAPRGVDDFPAMMAEITDDAPAILLLHEPDFWIGWRARFALSLAGHTHGGQVRLFGWSPIVPSRFGNRFAYGPVEEEGASLVVSGGLGCSIAPVRLGMPPEITVVNLA